MTVIKPHEEAGNEENDGMSETRMNFSLLFAFKRMTKGQAGIRGHLISKQPTTLKRSPQF